MRICWLLLCLLFLSVHAKALPDSVQYPYTVPVSMGEDDLSETDFERMDYWTEYVTHPIDLNAVTLFQLQTLPFLEDGEAERIYQYRLRYGAFTSIYELAGLERITHQRARFLASFFYVGPPPQRVIAEIVQQLGYRDKVSSKKDHLGVVLFRETRATVLPNHSFRLGLRGRNLPGEPFGGSYSRFGYINYSGFVEYTSLGKLPVRMVIGNYACRVGYGLLFTTSKLSFPTQRVYSLSGEKEIPRGAFATSSSGVPLGLALSARLWERLSVLLAVSYRPVNATYSLNADKRYLRTVDISEAFDTKARMRWRATTRETLALLHLKYTTPRFKLGMAALCDYLAHPFLSKQKMINDLQAELKSSAMVRVGINGMYRFNRLRIWSEGVYTALREYNFNSGALTGLLATDYRTQRLGILAAECYYYGRGNVSRYQQNYSRTSHPRDRWGSNFYYSYWLTSRAKVAAVYRFSSNLHENRQRTLLQEHEWECLGELETEKQHTWQLRYKYQYRERPILKNYETFLSRHDAKVRCRIPITSNISWVSQFQMVLTNKKGTSRYAHPGGALFQEVRYASHFFLSTLSVAYFLLNGSNATLYFGAPALPYTFPLHTMRNSGVRFAVLGSAQVLKWVRMAIQVTTIFFNEKNNLHYSDTQARMQCVLTF